ncbi:MAG: ribosomal L7Ae/L30e/S12e/Gadd45 family protein [Clostridia bacterium]|nr:ribosomal L7Ae/L30e/S12e/Gadd45 family protein [Clostridia bacterium]
MNNKIDSFLSLASRARKLISGQDMVVTDLKSFKRKTKLVILATDAKDKTKEEVRLAAEHAGVEVIEYSTKEEIGRLIGKDVRSVIGITDDNFAMGIIKSI